MKGADINLFLFFAFTLFVILLMGSYQFKELKGYYIFEIKPTLTTKGFVSKSETYIDRDGVRSFRYVVKYSVQNTTYILNESSPLVAISGVYQNDSVLVKFVFNDPKIATIKTKEVRNIGILVLVLVTVVEFVMIIRFCKYLRRWINFRFHTSTGL